MHFDLTESDAQCSYNVYCDSILSPFRIACVWEVHAETDGDTYGKMYYNDYDMYVYKNGEEVASSKSRNEGAFGKNTNFEIVEIGEELLEEYGAGYYEVKIKRYSKGTAKSTRIGLAWEQP